MAVIRYRKSWSQRKKDNLSQDSHEELLQINVEPVLIQSIY
jgi:hypothetical protein